MNNAYSAYFQSLQCLKEATQQLEGKDYNAAASLLKQTLGGAQRAVEEPALTANAIQTYTTSSILLIAVYIRLNNQGVAQEKQKDATLQLQKWSKQANLKRIQALCRYCGQLLITGCQHSRCVGHCVQQLEELNHAQEQT